MISILKAIQQRLVLLTVLGSMLILVWLVLFIKSFVVFMINMKAFLALLFLASIILSICLLFEYDRYHTAKRIIENEIMNIQVATIEQDSCKVGSDMLSIDTIEFIISCFGILYGSKVVKFNVGGIHLKEVKIAHDYIYMIYGKNKKNKIVKLLHGAIGKSELQGVAERFHYETGIVPNMSEIVEIMR